MTKYTTKATENTGTLDRHHGKGTQHENVLAAFVGDVTRSF